MSDSPPPNGGSLRDSTSAEQDAEAAIAPAAVRSQLQTILATEAFRRSARSGRLLQKIVEYTLGDRADELKEYSLALDVFDRPPSFDPRVDPIVRVEVGRLRKKLREYYETEGSERPIRITLPLRRYAAVIT